MLELSSMSNLIAEKPNRIMSIQQEPLKLKTAYDYLNRLSFTINGICNKTVELLLGDAVCLVGDSKMINLILTKVGVHSLMPKKYGGFGRNSNVFILDAGNCTDVYQFVDFMKQYGLNIKKTLKQIMISRVFTVYQLTHFLKYELPKTIHEHKINVVIIPELLAMFAQEPEINIRGVESLLREIADLLKEVPSKYKVLLITSISLDNNKLSSDVLDVRNKVLSMFNKHIKVDMNKTNDKFKVFIQEKQDLDYVTVKKYLSLSYEDVLIRKEMSS
jgi:hypothetical protein